MTAKLSPLPQVTTAWVDAQGKPTIAFMQYMQALAAGNVGPFTSAKDDAGAAKAGVPMNTFYLDNNGFVRMRLS